MTLTTDEIMDIMKDRESPDDILDILEPTTDDLVEGLQDLIIKRYEELSELYDTGSWSDSREYGEED